MNRPEVRILEPQQIESKEVVALDWEAQQLLQKYGYTPDQIQQSPAPVVPAYNPQANLSFEEMCRLEEAEKNRELEIQKQRQRQSQQPDPRYYNNNYVTDNDSGFNYKIEIRTEGGLQLPRY